MQDGFIKRYVPEENRRKVLISLTDKGIKTYNKINRDNDSFFGTVINTLPKKDLPIFLKSFEMVVNKMIQCNSGNS